MSTPLRNRQRCQPATAKELYQVFRLAVHCGYDVPTAKRVAVQTVERAMQDGRGDHGRRPSQFDLQIVRIRKGTATGGKETTETFDRLIQFLPAPKKHHLKKQ